MKMINGLQNCTILSVNITRITLRWWRSIQIPSLVTFRVKAKDSQVFWTAGGRVFPENIIANISLFVRNLTIQNFKKIP